MKKYLLLLPLFCFCTSLFAQDNSLDQRLTIKFQQKTLAEVFTQLEQQTNLTFAYSTDFLPIIPFSISFRNRRIQFILDRLTKRFNLRYLKQNDKIIVTLNPQQTLNQAVPEVPRYTLSGYLRDATSSETLIGGTLFLQPGDEGTDSNVYGYYSITLPEGDYRLQCSYVGYQSDTLDISLFNSQKLNIELKTTTNDLKEVVVKASPKKKSGILPVHEKEHIDISDLENLPNLLGEQDIFGTLQLLPGVTATGEGNAGLSIRGGGSDQNLILLDEAPVYNPAHMLGLFSIFNPDAIKDVRLMKGEIPTEYRGRLSSVMDIRMKEGNNKNFGGSGGIGLLMSRLSFEGKFAKGKGSFMLAGRRSYLDVLVKLFTGGLFNRDGIFLYDLNAKANYQINTKNHIFISAYRGEDVFKVGDFFKIDWGNTTTTLRWNHLFNDKLFSNTSLIFSDFDFLSSTDLGELVDDDFGQSSLNLRTRIQDFHLKHTYNYYATPHHFFKFGISTIHHSFIPGRLIDEFGEVEPGKPSTRFAVESGAFLAHQWKITPKLSVDYGLHFSNMAVLGGNDFIFFYDDSGVVKDSSFFKKGELIKNHLGIEPRLSTSLKLDAQNTLKFSYAHTVQYLQLLPSAFVNNPASVWLPSSHIIQPQRGNQFSLGHFQTFAQKSWSSSVELFFNHHRNQIAYRDGARLELGTDIESQLVFGQAWAYGAEFLLKKQTGRWRGWISYTISEGRNQFDKINRSKIFRSEFDRPHSLAIVGLFNPTPNCTLAATWTYVSGKLVTVPTGKYEIDGQVIDFYGERNNFRMSNHHRLDIAVRWHKVGKRGIHRYWNFALHNVYARKNPSFVYVNQLDLIDLNTEDPVVEISLLSIVPSFSFMFEF